MRKFVLFRQSLLSGAKAVLSVSAAMTAFPALTVSETLSAFSAVTASAVLTALPSGAAYAAPSSDIPAEWLQALTRQQNTATEFTQTKILSHGKGPKLRSTGKALFSESHGLAWIQEKPFAQKILINNERVVMQTRQDAPEIIRAADKPEIHRVVSTLKAVFEGNSKQFEQAFRTSVRSSPGGWELTLEPKNETLGKIMKTVVLTGKEKVESVILNETSGVRTEIIFGTSHPLKDHDNQNFELLRARK